MLGLRLPGGIQAWAKVIFLQVERLNEAAVFNTHMVTPNPAALSPNASRQQTERPIRLFTMLHDDKTAWAYE